jgi:hypothetical protein
MEYERIVVATASRATATNPEINRRFMENSVGSICSVACTPHYGQRSRVNVGCVTYHDLVFGSVGRFHRDASGVTHPLYVELNLDRSLPDRQLIGGDALANCA